MGVITDVLTIIDDTIGVIAQLGFEAGAGAVGDVISVGASLVLALMAANVLLQVRPMTVGSFLAFGVKIALVAIFARSWSNFSVVFDILTDVPQNVGNNLLALTDAGSSDGLYASLDAFLARFTEFGDAIGDNAGWMFGAILGATFFIIAAIFAGVASGIIAFASVVLTAMVVIAPYTITCSMFASTKSIFDSWSRALIGYAAIPIITGVVLGIIANAGELMMRSSVTPNAVEEISAILPFVVILFLSVGMMALIPSIAQNISGAFGLASNAAGLNNLAREGMFRTAQLGAGMATGGAGYAAGAAVRAATGSSPAELRTAARDGVSDTLRQRSVGEGRHSAASTLAMHKEWRDRRREFAARSSAGAGGLMARPGGAPAAGAGKASRPSRSTPPKPSPTTPTRGATP